jgi:hypothetical protein
VNTWPWPLLLSATALEAVYLGILLLQNLKEKVCAFIPLAFVAGVLYLISVWLIFRKRKGREAAGPPAGNDARSVPRRPLIFIFAAGIVFRATLFPLYPALSDDLFRYRWDGKVAQAGFNPYQLRPDDPRLQHLRDSTWQGVNGKYHVAVYGPLTESLFRWWYPVAVLPGNEFLSVLLMKLPMLAFDLGVALLLMKLLAVLMLPAERVLVYWWAPVSVIEFAASGHNDSVGTFFLVLALLGVALGEKRWSLAALAAATFSKLLAAFVWPVVVPGWLEKRRWRDFFWPVLVAAVAYWPFRGTLLNRVPSITQYSGDWRNNDSLFGVFYALTGSPLAASAAAGAVVAAVAGFLAGRRLPPLRATFLVLGTLLACASQVFPWYLAWILPLLAVFPNAAWLMLSVLIFLSYNVLIDYGALGIWHDNPKFQWLEYAPFYALLIGSWLYSQLRREESPQRHRVTEP